MEPFLGEIRAFPWAWAPVGWAKCDGTLLPCNQNQALFSLLGNRYGGSSPTTFALPDLRGRAMAGMGAAVGVHDGVEAVAITSLTMPSHLHLLQGTTSAGDSMNAKGGIPASVGSYKQQATIPIYCDNAAVGNNVTLNQATIDPYGNGSPHSNMQPFAVVNFCIATAGVYPSRQ